MRVKDKVTIITDPERYRKRDRNIIRKEGSKVVVADVNEKAGNEVVETIKNAGGEAFFAMLDVSNRPQTKQVVKDTIEKYGKVDVLINNAGIIQDSLVVKMTEEQWDRVISIT